MKIARLLVLLGIGISIGYGIARWTGGEAATPAQPAPAGAFAPRPARGQAELAAAPGLWHYQDGILSVWRAEAGSGWRQVGAVAVRMPGDARLTRTDLGGPGSVLLSAPPEFRLFRWDGERLAEQDYALAAAPRVTEAGQVIHVDAGSNWLWFYENGRLLLHARVATGKDRGGDPPRLENSVTPTGTFKIGSKVVAPAWKSVDGRRTEAPGSPTNPLGSHWLGFSVYGWDNDSVWGLHGTDEPELIGGWVSDGCVRMKNADVERLFALVRPGAVLRIVDSTR